MEIKRNEATLNRPDGDRVIDGSYVFVDIPALINQLREEKAWEKNDRNGITVFKSEKVAIVLAAFQKGASLDENIVNGFITLQVIQGTARITTPDGDVEAGPQQTIMFHPGIKHSVEALSDLIILLTNHITKKEKQESRPFSL